MEIKSSGYGFLFEADDARSPNIQDGAQRTRRLFLALLGGGLAALALGVPATGRAGSREKRLSLRHVATGESWDGPYWRRGEGYLMESCSQIDSLMRDHHNNQVMSIDVRLLDRLHDLQTTLGARHPMHVISGYRSPQTNARLARKSRYVSTKSYHLRGKAADVRIPGIRTTQLHRVALAQKAGGVGCYGKSRFVHVDTGPVRSWRG